MQRSLIMVRVCKEGSGNVFADIGVRDPDGSLVRAKLAKQIAELIRRKRLRQNQVADILGVDQSKVSKLVRGRISGFTSDRLLRYLNALGCDSPHPDQANSNNPKTRQGGSRRRLKTLTASCALRSSWLAASLRRRVVRCRGCAIGTRLRRFGRDAIARRASAIVCDWVVGASCNGA